MEMTIEFILIILSVIAAGLIILSWRSLRDLRHHGIYCLLAGMSSLELSASLIVDYDVWWKWANFGSGKHKGI